MSTAAITLSSCTNELSPTNDKDAELKRVKERKERKENELPPRLNGDYEETLFCGCWNA